MKNSAVFLCALLFTGMLSFSTSAQIKATSGIKGGMSMANLSNAKTLMELPSGVDCATRYGFTGFLFFNVQFIDVIGAQVEAGYAMKGTRIKGTMTGEDEGVPVSAEAEGTMAVDYLEIPLLAKLCIPMPAVNPYVYAGPSLGIMLASKYYHKISATVGGQSQSEEGTEDIKEHVNGTDFGLAFGAGITLPMGFLVDARYTLGLGTIAKKENETTPPDLKNGVFAIMVGYGFRL
jgi:hypothetical protein